MSVELDKKKVRFKKSLAHYISIIIFILLTLICLSALIPDMISPPPKIKEGLFDLRIWDFQKDGNIALDGEWKFMWNRFSDAVDFERLPFEIVNVPAVWNSYKTRSGRIPPAGFATYATDILIDSTSDILAFKFLDINTAYQFSINDTMLVETGQIGISKASMRPQYLPRIVIYKPTEKRLKLILKVSNYYYDMAGIWKRIYFGEVGRIMKQRESKKTRELFITGALLIMAFYHLGLFFLGKKDRILLLAGIFCSIVMIRSIITGERFLLEYLPHISWRIAYIIEFQTVYLSLPIFLYLLLELFPEDTNKTIVHYVMRIGVVWSIVTIFLPSMIFMRACAAYVGIVLIPSCYFIIYILIRAFIFKRKPAGMMLIGGLVMIGTIFNDLLYSGYFVQTGYYMPFGTLFFIMTIFSINLKFVRAQDDLYRNQEKTVALFRILPDSMIHINHLGRILDFNINDEDKSRYPELKEPLGKHLMKILPQILAQDIMQNIPVLAETDDDVLFEESVAIDHSVIYYEIRMVRSEGNSALVIMRDITEKKHAEKQLLQADKLVALGTLVSGVAHEINNPNNAILLSSGTLLNIWNDLQVILDGIVEESGDFKVGRIPYSFIKEDVSDSFERTIKNSKRIKAIVEDLKDFARIDDAGMMQEIDANEVIRASVRLMENLIKRSTRNFSLNLSGSLPIIRANFQQLEQVIVNVIQNACQALTDMDQKIVVTTEILKDIDCIEITIQDEGTGMDKPIVKRILDPFYTTRRKTGGTGLGLSVSSRIIANHKGIIEFDSLPGKGTTCRIMLPI